jgi:hypothetical protein
LIIYVASTAYGVYGPEKAPPPLVERVRRFLKANGNLKGKLHVKNIKSIMANMKAEA